jgi:replication factor A1
MSDSQDNLPNESQDDEQVTKENESTKKDEIELVEKKISDLSPFDRKLYVNFVVIDKGEPREITSRKTQETHTLADITIGDETGIITLTLWDDTINQITEGETYAVKNGYVNVFQQRLRLALGKWGSLVETDVKITLDSVNMDNNRSEEIHEDRRRRRRSGGRSREGRRGSYGRRDRSTFGERDQSRDYTRY